MRTRFFSYLFIVCLIGGASLQACTESEAIRIAKIKTQDGSTAKFELKATRSTNGWLVLVWALPKVPGGYSVIHVSKDCVVVKVDQGL